MKLAFLPTLRKSHRQTGYHLRPLVVLALIALLALLAGSAAAQEGPKTHVVKAGETAQDIADLYGVTVEDLLAANEVATPDQIVVGMTLVIPAAAEMEAAPAVETTPAVESAPVVETAPVTAPSPATSGGQTYVVQPQDTLDTIATALEIDLNALIDANFGPGDDPGLIFPGQELIVPGSAVIPDGQGGGGGATTGRTATEDQTYTVQIADTLDQIAQAYEVAPLSIAYANGLAAPYVIRPGQLLLIPGDAPAYGTVPPLSDQARYATKYNGQALNDGQGGGGGGEEYTVQIADTLDTIAQDYDVAMLSIAYLNELEAPYVLMPGDVLVIPTGAPPYGVIPPVPGQSLNLE